MAAGASEQLAGLRERCVEQLIAGAAREAQALLAEALRAAPVATVYCEILTEALYEIGRRWQRGEIGVAEEHLATGICEVLLPDLAALLPRGPRRRRTAIVACAPGELHAVGSRIVADFLEADGWDVLHLGASTPAPALVELVVARNVDVVALSTAAGERFGEVGDTCGQLLGLPQPPLVALGGLAVVELPEGVRDGIVVAHSPDALVRLLDECFPR